MADISEDSDLCTVIVTVDADAAVIPQLEEHASAGLDAFREFDGFVSGALHVSRDGRRIVQYLQWRSEADYETCVNAALWDDWPSTARFLEFVESGRATMDAQTYAVRRTAKGDLQPNKPKDRPPVVGPDSVGSPPS